MSILKINKVEFTYENTGVQVLKPTSVEFEKGKFYAVVGKSGSGKSTFLGLLAGLDTPTAGEIKLILPQWAIHIIESIILLWCFKIII